MKLNAKAMAVTIGLLWGGSVFLVAVLNRVWPTYGVAFLHLAGSIYPGFHPGGLRDAVVGTLYALLDGAAGGFVLAWVYNKVSGTGAGS